MKHPEYTGVYENTQNSVYKSKWMAIISINGKQRRLMYTDDPIKAAKEYDRWARYYGKNKSKLNFPNDEVN